MKKFCILLLALLLSAPLCFAQEAEVPGMDELWDQVESYGVEADGGLDQGLSNLFSDALDQIGSLLRTSIATGLKLLAVVLLCAMAEGAAQGKSEGLQAVEIAGALAITALTMTDMAVMIGMGRDTIGRMGTFSETLLPVMAAHRRHRRGDGRSSQTGSHRPVFPASHHRHGPAPDPYGICLRGG